MAKKRFTPAKLRLLFLVLIIGSGFVSIGLSILVIVGMLPTLAAWMGESSKQKVTSRTIAPCNVAGLIPPAIEIIPYGQNMTEVTRIIQDMATWSIIFLSAAAGWGVFFVVPKVVRWSLSRKLSSRQYYLQQQQQKLVDEWGTKVSLSKPELQSIH